MQNIIQELMNIEKKSKLIMEKIEKDEKKLPQLIDEKISQGIRLVKLQERDKLIQLNKEVDLDTALKLEKLNKGFEEKEKQLKLEYENNKNILVEKILSNILSCSFGGEI